MHRLLDMLVVLVGVATVVFFTMRLSGDPVLLLVTESATPQEIDHLRDLLGFNDPMWLQYFRFLAQAAVGNFGESLRFQVPAVQLVMETVPFTALLATAAVLFSVVCAVPLGVMAAVKRGTVLDALTTSLSLLGLSMPVFWLGMMLIIVFAVQLKWLPTSGSETLAHLILPTVALGAYSMGRIARLTRSSMLEVLRQEYVNTARAKGLAERVVIFRHAMRNAAIPIVTIVGLEFGTLLGGAVVTETVFAWPGLGRLIVQGISYRDYPIVQSGVFYISVIFVFINMALDMLYTTLDPRVRYQ